LRDAPEVGRRGETGEQAHQAVDFMKTLREGIRDRQVLIPSLHQGKLRPPRTRWARFPVLAFPASRPRNDGDSRKVQLVRPAVPTMQCYIRVLRSTRGGARLPLTSLPPCLRFSQQSSLSKSSKATTAHLRGVNGNIRADCVRACATKRLM